MSHSFSPRNQQQGSMLLEALIAIVIFSIGILAIVGLQANAIRMSSDAKFRSEASLLANQYISSMWGDLATAVTATTGLPPIPTPFSATEFNSFNSGGANFNTWYNNVVQGALPNASAVVATNTVLTCGTTVAIPPCSAGVQQSTTTTATVTINWKLPSGDSHSYSTVTILSAQK